MKQLRCPRHGDDCRVTIHGVPMDVELVDDGAEAVGDMEWEGDDRATCSEGWEGTVDDLLEAEQEPGRATAHTPGPWVYKATAGNHDFSVYPEATGCDVALVRDFNEANARLIAAAPDLLEALRVLVGAYGRGLPALEYRAAVEGARAAIAKAERRGA